MNEDAIAIVLTDQVSEEPARKIKFLGDVARSTHDTLKMMREMLTGINASAVRKLQDEMTASVTAATRQATAIERLEAAQARTATATARLEAAQAKTTTALTEGAIASQRLATEQERTERTATMAALAKEKLEQATRRNTEAQERDGDAAVKLYLQNEKLIDQARRQQAAASAQAIYTGGYAPGLLSQPTSAKASAGVFIQDAREKEAAAKATADLERSTIALKAASDPLFAAQQQYNRTMAEANRLLAAGALSQAEHGRVSTLATQGLTSAEHAAARLTDATKLSRFQILTLQYTINDVAASLASGASPFTILMQQGGQVTQAWGGLLPTLRAAGAALMTTVGLIVSAAAVVAGLVLWYDHAGAAGREFTKTVIETGGASGKTTSDLLTMASTVKQVGDVSRGAATDTVAAFVANGTIAGTQIEHLATTAVKMQREMGAAVKDTVATFASLGEDPVQASEKLNKSTHYLTLATYEQIVALRDRGDKDAAGELAQNTYANAMDERTAKLSKNLGLLETAWRGLRAAAVWAWDGMLGAGRDDATKTKLADLQNALEKAQQRMADKQARGITTPVGGMSWNEVEGIKQQIAGLSEVDRLERKSTELQREQASLVEKKIAWNKQGLEVEDHATKRLREGNIARELNNTLLKEGAITQEQAATRLAEINKKYKDEKKAPDKSNAFAGEQAAAKEWAAAMLEADGLMNKANGKVQELTASEVAYNKYLGDTATTLNGRVSPAMRELLADKLHAAAATEKQAKADAEVEKVSKTLVAGAYKEVDALNAKLAKQLEANAQMGMTKAQILEEKAAREELTAQADDDAAAALRLASIYAGEYTGAYLQYANALEESARRRRELSKAEAEGGIRQAAVEGADKAEKAWAAADKKIEDGLYEAISNGGDSALKKLLKDAKEWFARLILSPVIQPIASFGASLMNPTAASAAGSAGSALGGLNNLWGLGSGGGSAGFANFATSSAGELLGLSSAVDLNAALEMGAISADAYASALAAGAETVNVMSGAASTLASGWSSMSSALSSVGPWGWAAMALMTQLGGPQIDKVGGGLVGNLSGGGSSMQQYDTYKEDHHGVFGIGAFTTTNKEFSDNKGATDYVNKAVTIITAANKAYGEALGLNADALDKYTEQIDIDTTGMSAAQAQAALDAKLTTFATNQANAAYGEALAAFALGGETAAQTLTRLSTDLTTVNGWAALFGTTLYDVSLTGAAAASTLIKAFGGLDKFNSAMDTYYKTYYTNEEQKQKTLQGIQLDLSKQGIDISIDELNKATEEGVRKWVDAAIELFKVGSITADQLAVIINSANRLAPTLNQQPADPPSGNPNGPAGETQSQYEARIKWAQAHPWESFLGGSDNGKGGINYGPDYIQGQSGGAGGGASIAAAAGDLTTAFRDLTDALNAEVERIRGTVQEDSGPGGYLEAKRQFDLATEKARGGDKAALADLPRLSQLMLRLAEVNESTLAGLNFIRGMTMASLQLTALMMGGDAGGGGGAVGNAASPIAKVGQSVQKLQASNSRMQSDVALLRGQAMNRMLSPYGSDGGTLYDPPAYNSNNDMRIIPTTNNTVVTDPGASAMLVQILAAIAAGNDNTDAIKQTNQKVAEITEKSDTIGPAPTRASA